MPATRAIRWVHSFLRARAAPPTAPPLARCRSADRPRCWPAPGPRIDRSPDGGRALRAWARWPPTAEREVMRLYAHAPVQTTSCSSPSTQFISKHNELTSKLFKSSDQILHTVSHESHNFVFVLYTSILLVTFICYFTSRIPGGSHRPRDAVRSHGELRLRLASDGEE